MSDHVCCGCHEGEFATRLREAEAERDELRAEVKRLKVRRDEADQHDCMYMEEDFQRMKTRAEKAEAALRRVYGTALLIREHGCSPGRINAILDTVEDCDE